VPHFTETFAIDIASTNGGGRITYGADCSPNEELVKFARETDLLIVEATLPRPERTGIRGHLTPEEAAEHAARAKVKRVLLTHVSDELDELWVRACARRAFSGPVSVAQEGAVYDLSTAAPAPAAEEDVTTAPAPPPRAPQPAPPAVVSAP
jgi:ribonuclease BN (tRNA processing enzyme)